MTRKKLLLTLAAVIGIAALAGASRAVYYIIHFETTDDAQIQGDIYPVAPKISGYVGRVYVKENERVEAGALLLELEPRDYEVKRDTARAGLERAQAAVAVAGAQVQQARAQRDQSSTEEKRYATLLKRREVSEQQYEAVRATAISAAAAYDAALQQVGVEKARLDEEKALLEAAELNVSYTTLHAPAAGIVAHKSIEPGQFVQAGQPLMAIVDTDNLWVVANFKETQLQKMHTGQETRIKVDAYPEHDLTGMIDSISPATGARFALLPPDNATGNFVKVVQRVPVKIVFRDALPERLNLLIGMSVEAEVDLRETPASGHASVR
ncbi:MAG: HlyD family secretion protein [Chrysiogenetes bacterium]|nr:HlyD family secretion protein [Chrysiogenetes bacterium]